MDTLLLPARIEALYRAIDFVVKAAEDSGWKDDRTRLEVAVEEIFVNIASYAYGGEAGRIQIGCGLHEGMFVVQFRDWGKPFNPLKQPEPDIDSPAARRPIGGLGIYLTKTYADCIFYEYADGVNILTIGMNLQKEENYENH